jgi:hypothetical protein
MLGDEDLMQIADYFSIRVAAAVKKCKSEGNSEAKS